MKDQISNTQRIILQELGKNKSMFIDELIEHPNFKDLRKTRALRGSMYCIFKRNLVKRILDYNPKSRPNYHNQYKYMITAKGEEILSKSLKKISS